MLVDPANTMTELLRFSVNLTQKAADRLVEGSKREEAAVPQPRQNPATNDLYPHLNFGFGESRQMQLVWERPRPKRFVSPTPFIPFTVARLN